MSSKCETCEGFVPACWHLTVLSVVLTSGWGYTKGMITSVRLKNFRSYTNESFEFGPHVNIVVGPNGSGKTNLLEALLVLAHGGSYRAADAELVRFDQPWLRLDAQTDAGTRTVKITALPALVKQYELNDKPYRRLLRHHTVPLVLFEPNHLRLLHGAPERRRTYLDGILEQTQPEFGGYLRNYRRVLAQRNALLKRPGGVSGNELFPWDLRLSELGAAISRARAQLVAELAEELPDLYAALSSEATASVTVRYEPQFAAEQYETQLLHALEHHLAKDIARGFTAYGPHREDMAAYFGPHLAANVASRGETRTVVLALKILELQLLERARQTTPLLLLDDVFSELDSTRRRALTGYLQHYQTFLTTTDADTVEADVSTAKILRLFTPPTQA